MWSIDDYAKEDRLGEVQHLCEFNRESLRNWTKTIINKLGISNHTALIPGVHDLKLICEYELHSLPNKIVSGPKVHGKSYINVRPPLVRHLLRNRLLILGSSVFVWTNDILQKISHSKNKYVM